MVSALKTIKRHKLLLAVGFLVIAVAVVAVHYTTGDGERIVASGVVSVSANPETETFAYTGNTVNQTMTLGCNVPASIKITCQSLTKRGVINVYINGQNYATGTVTTSGEVTLSSGCGCSTVCICQIKVGENTAQITSDTFQGQLKYEIYVK